MIENTDISSDYGISIGRIISVSAAQLIVHIDIPLDGTLALHQKSVELSTLLKIQTRTSVIFGIVSGLRIPLPSAGNHEEEFRIMELELIGEITSAPIAGSEGFRRGISVFPLLGAPVYFANSNDLINVYAPPREPSVLVGSLHQDSDIPARLLIDNLFGKHFSIVGTTGTGKSCAVATILGSVVRQSPEAHIIVLDPHGEYAPAFPDEAYVLTPDCGLRLPYWLLNFEELAEVVLEGAHRAAQGKILYDAVLSAKQASYGKSDPDRRLSIDTPTSYRVSDLIRHLDNTMGSLDRPDRVADYQVVKARMIALQGDPRFAFMFGTSLTLRDEMSDVLGKLFRIPVDDKPITILDLSGIPSEVLNVVVSVICRLTFDFALWSETQTPITIVCEEAHRYAPRDGDAGFEPVKRALSRIAKEGRKYGVSLCLVSQRPSDLAPNLLSQCNTMFAMRMTNHDDQEIIRGALPEAAHGLMQFLPALRNGEAIVVGEGVSMPMRICFSPLPSHRRPKSATASFAAAWAVRGDGRNEMEKTIERWRRGSRHAA